MIIYEPRRFRYPQMALPVQLDVEFLVIRVFVRDYRLFVSPLDDVAVFEIPLSCLGRLVVRESAFVVSPVGEDPSSLNNLVVAPSPKELHPTVSIRISPIAFLLAELPKPCV